jgi:hypothetical protein
MYDRIPVSTDGSDVAPQVGVERALLGSVTERVLRSIHRPVLAGEGGERNEREGPAA